MTTLETKAQQAISCDHCVKQAQLFCKSCQKSLCGICKAKHTVVYTRGYQDPKSHDIVPFIDIPVATPECKEHPGRSCEAHCQQCHIPVCIKCLCGPHQGHTAEDLTYEKKLEDIQYETEQIQNKIIPTWEKEDSEMEVIIAQAMAKFDDVGRENEKIKHIWHQEVNSIFDEISLMMQELENKNLESLDGHQKDTRSQINEMSEIAKQNKSAIVSKDLSKINSFTRKLLNYQTYPKSCSSLQWPNLQVDYTNEHNTSVKIKEFEAILTHSFAISPNNKTSSRKYP